MNLLFLTQQFPPETGTKAVRLFELTKRLAAAGHRVQVITALPNYPTGRIFAGYRGKVRLVEELEGVRIIRTWIYPSNSERALFRVLSSLSFVMSSVAFGLWGVGRQNVLLFDSPPLFLVPAGLAIGRMTGARIIMNVSDIWPDIVIRMGYPIGSLSLWLMQFLERIGYEWCDAVSVTNPTAREQIRRRFPEVKVAVISNAADLDKFYPNLRNPQMRSLLGAGDEDFLVGYCGLHGLAQGLEVVVEAAAKLKDYSRMKFVMVGDGPTKTKLTALAKQLELDNVLFLDRLDRTEIPSILASCDAGLVPLSSELPGTMPGKFYETLASGVPVVITKGCEGEPLVNEFNVGRTFRPMNADDLASALLDLMSDPGARDGMRQDCRELARRFDRGVVARRAEEVIRAVAEKTALPEVRW